MIKSEAAYEKAKKEIVQRGEFVITETQRLKEIGLTDEQVKRALEPYKLFAEEAKEEVEYYEKIKRGEFDPIYNLNQIGKTLIAYRVYSKMTQAELATKLGVAESQVSRDERNEYYGSSIEKIQEIMDAMNMKINISLEFN